MTTAFPGAIDSFPRPLPDTKRNAAAGLNLSTVIDNLSDASEAIEPKVGISESSPQNTPLANTVLQSLTNGKSKWATIITGMIAANAVTQNAFATGSGGITTTTSGSYVDLLNMSTTLTTVGGDLVVIMIGAFMHSTVGSAIVLALSLDAAAEVGAFSITHRVAATPQMQIAMYRFTGVAAGSHTVKARWLTNAATATANGQDRYQLMIELKK